MDHCLLAWLINFSLINAFAMTHCAGVCVCEHKFIVYVCVSLKDPSDCMPVHAVSSPRVSSDNIASYGEMSLNMAPAPSHNSRWQGAGKSISLYIESPGGNKLDPILVNSVGHSQNPILGRVNTKVVLSVSIRPSTKSVCRAVGLTQRFLSEFI